MSSSTHATSEPSRAKISKVRGRGCRFFRRPGLSPVDPRSRQKVETGRPTVCAAVTRKVGRISLQTSSSCSALQCPCHPRSFLFPARSRLSAPEGNDSLRPTRGFPRSAAALSHVRFRHRFPANAAITPPTHSHRPYRCRNARPADPLWPPGQASDAAAEIPVSSCRDTLFHSLSRPLRPPVLH